MSKYKVGDYVLVTGQPGGLEDWQVNIIGKITSTDAYGGEGAHIAIKGRTTFAYHSDAFQPLDTNTQSYLEWKEGV